MRYKVEISYSAESAKYLQYYLMTNLSFIKLGFFFSFLDNLIFGNISWNILDFLISLITWISSSSIFKFNLAVSLNLIT